MGYGFPQSNVMMGEQHFLKMVVILFAKNPFIGNAWEELQLILTFARQFVTMDILMVLKLVMMEI